MADISSITLSIPAPVLLKPTDAQGYLASAKGMFEGIKPLAAVSPLPVYAITLLCGHACEASLKALLSKSGMKATELSRKPFGHDMLKLWEAAEQDGYSLTPSPPRWLVSLDQVYGRPFYLRYPLGFHGIGFPNQTEMIEGTEYLLRLALSAVEQAS